MLHLFNLTILNKFIKCEEIFIAKWGRYHSVGQELLGQVIITEWGSTVNTSMFAYL